MVTQTQIPLPLVELLVVKRSTQCTASLTRSHFVVDDDDVDYDDDDDDEANQGGKKRIQKKLTHCTASLTRSHFDQD